MFEFGSGTLFGYPIGGNTAPNATPSKFGTLQDVSQVRVDQRQDV